MIVVHTLTVYYIPNEDDPIWTCVPEGQVPTTRLSIEDNAAINGVPLSTLIGVTVDFIAPDAYGSKPKSTWKPVEPALYELDYPPLGTPEEVLEELKQMGYKPPTVEECCEMFGTQPGEFNYNECI